MTKLPHSFALVLLTSFPFSVRAAEISIDDITVPIGTATVDVPILIAPSSASEMIGAMNIFFGAGTPADAIPILNTGTEFDGSIWETGTEYIGAPGTSAVNVAMAAVAMISPLEVSPDGTLITYTLDTSGLPAGNYVLDPDFQIDGVGTEANDGKPVPAPLDLTFIDGTLRIQAMQLLDGDYNGNGTVEQADLDLVLLNWGNPAEPVPNGWINDLPEGNIDQAELDGVLLNWGDMEGGPMAAASVPEPATWISAGILGVIAMTLRLRRRCSIATK